LICSTVASQARAVTADADRAARQSTSPLILGRSGGSKLPAFMVHGGPGFVFFKPVFLDIVAEDRSIYLFQALGLDDSTIPLESVEGIAAFYIKAMRAVQPIGPYHVVAMCAGAFIALEMCNQLVESGQAVAGLVLLDPPPVLLTVMEKERIKRLARKQHGHAVSFLASFLRTGRYKKAINYEKAIKDLELGHVPEPVKARLRKKIERHLNSMKSVPAAQRSQTAERMFKASVQLRAALYKHVPRRYSGNAALLVNSASAQELFEDAAFWPSHLSAIQYEVLGSEHKDLFHEQLSETARFVKKALG
jgi:thioesterase domain-containing protein